MDDRQFDGITRAIGQTTNRRQAIRGLMALAAGAVGLKVAGAEAARRGYGGPGNTDSTYLPPSIEFRFFPFTTICLVYLRVLNALPNFPGEAQVYNASGSLLFDGSFTTDAKGYALLSLGDLVPERSSISAIVEVGDAYLKLPLTYVHCTY